MLLSTKTLLTLLPFFVKVQAGASGTGKTTRYWDCCKPSCAWSGKTSLLSGSTPVTTCDISDKPLTDFNAASGCNGGAAYQCSNESPWAVSDDLAYGYAAVNIVGGSEASWCCACYELTFTSGAVKDKKMIVQATNTGGDLAGNQFDISMPGGGVGIFNGCTTQWGAPSSGWGAQYGGISGREACDSFPDALKDGCYWRFDWFGGSDNPEVSFTQVACPAALTAKTGCVRADDGSAALPAPVSSKATTPSSSSIAAVVPASSSPAAVHESSVESVATASPATVANTSPAAVIESPATTPTVSDAAPILIPTPTAMTEPTTPSSEEEEDDDDDEEDDDDDVCEI